MRAGCGMSRVGAWAAWARQGPAQGPEPPLLAAPRRDAVIAAVAAALTAAAIFAVMMALSRAYLGAHWLSDAIAGLLLGISCALITATAVDQAQRRYARPAAAAAARSVPSADRL